LRLSGHSRQESARLSLIANRGHTAGKPHRSEPDDGKGGQRYNARVLLDMDYFELMPKRPR
jgi:hypothetical protein